MAVDVDNQGGAEVFGDYRGIFLPAAMVHIVAGRNS